MIADFLIADCGFRTSDWGLRIRDFLIADWGFRIADCGFLDFGLRIICETRRFDRSHCGLRISDFLIADWGFRIKNAAKMIRKHKPLILNWFKARNHLSSGVVEGLNNRIKVTVKKSYGFRTFNVLQIALFHDLAKLPIPPPTHTF